MLARYSSQRYRMPTAVPVISRMLVSKVVNGLEAYGDMSQHIGASHRVETRIFAPCVGLLLVFVGIQGGVLRISVRFVLGIEQVIHGQPYRDAFRMSRLKAVGNAEVVNEIRVERVLLYSEVVQILAAHILRLQRSLHSFVEIGRASCRE